jgi:hypothetical protein
MSLNEGCGCNDNAQYTAQTAIKQLTTANPNLDGTGATTVITGASNGTLIKSIIIKAVQPVATGMIRLFIQATAAGPISLYREIPIPEYPSLIATPFPFPIMPMLEIDYQQEFKLQNASKLLVSTQTANKFNIIVEGLDWKYPTELKGCCDCIQESSILGVGTVSAANPNLDGTGAVQIFQAPADKGTTIKSITVAALQSTHKGMVRFFLSLDAGVTFFLWMEMVIPETIQSGFTPSFKQLLEEDYHIAAGTIIGATTQNSESFAITIEGLDWAYPI